MRSDIISGPTERVNVLPALTPVTCKEATLADPNLTIIPSDVKRCTKCGATKPADAFGRYGRGRRAVCGPCHSASTVEWQRSNPAKYSEKQKRWRAANKDRIRGYKTKPWSEYTPEQKARKAATSRVRHLQRKFGITLEQWQEMHDRQGGVCAICRIPGRVGRHGKLQVDHCHETGRIRGLLCGPCNVALGIFGDTADALARVLRYVRGEPHV
jgi:hypothetical protein